jgi:hypothetical protein
MVDDEVARRKGLTFEQAEGLSPLPTQLKRTEISSELRAVLWNYIYTEIENSTERDTYSYIIKPWSNVLKQVHVYRDHRNVDDFTTRFTDAIERPKLIFTKGSYGEIYGWLQFVLGLKPSADFAKKIDNILRYCRAPYRVIDATVICPIASDEEAATITKAFVDLKAAGLTGSREHLKKAAVELTAGDFAGSVRESIHAVESAVRVMEPSGDFSKALSKLEQKTNIHGALKKGFLALYGFSSDEQGIRHPLLEKQAPAVDEADAMFMIGACAAFLSYLINKSRSAGLLS